MTSVIGYKWLKDSNKSNNGSEPPWELNIWKQWNGELKLCQSGYHATRTPLESLQYIYGNRWYIVEAEGLVFETNDKFVCNRMRIIKELPVKEIMLRFAISCTKNSLFRFEKQYPNDSRPRKAIEIAEAFLLEKATIQDCKSAARSAESAARSAWSAAWSAWSAESAAWSAWSAAWSARSAESAAWSARSAARSAEQRWQNRTLERIIREY